MEHDHADPSQAGALHHIELCSDDLSVALNFWDWWLTELGYDRKDDWDGGRSWIHGPTYVVVKEAEHEDIPFDRNAAGLNHLAFHADSRKQVDEMTAGIRKREDAQVLYEDQHPYAGGYYALYCENPDGLKVELVGPD